MIFFKRIIDKFSLKNNENSINSNCYKINKCSNNHKIENNEIYKYYYKNKINNLNDILKLPIDLFKNFWNFELIYPKFIYGKDNILQSIDLNIENNIDIFEIDFDNDINNLVKYYQNNDENNNTYFYYINFIQSETRTLRKYLKSPICNINLIQLNNKFEYYFRCKKNNFEFIIKIILTEKNRHKIPDNILKILCVIQLHLYSIFYNTQNRSNTDNIIIEPLFYENNIYIKKQLDFFLQRIILFGTYLLDNKIDITDNYHQ